MKKYLFDKEKDPMLIGIELEVESPTRSEGQRDINAEAQGAISTIANASQVEMDFGRDGGGIENRFSPMSFKWIKNHKLFFQQILHHYKSVGFKGDSSRTAGIHIHFDRKVFTKENFVSFINWLRENKTFLHDLSHRQSRTGYTNIENTGGKTNYPFKEVNKEEWANAFEQWRTPPPREDDMHQWEANEPIVNGQYLGNDCVTLNGNGNGTVECRFFNATTDIERFMANISFIHALVFYIKSDRDKSLEGFIKYCNDYRYKYLDFVNFYLVKKGHLVYKDVSEIRISKPKKARFKKKRSNVQFIAG